MLSLVSELWRRTKNGREFFKVLFCSVILGPLREIWVALLAQARQP